MSKVKVHIFSGKKYEIDVDDPYVGATDCGFVKRITMPNGLDYGETKKAKEDLVTLLHECLHAEDWKLSEKRTDQISTDIGTLLWRLGYRRTKK